jgi:hypothetical protein
MMKTFPALLALAILAGCSAPPARPLTSCDMAATMIDSPRFEQRRLGASWVAQGAYDAP